MPKPSALSYLQQFPTPNIGDFYLVESYDKKQKQYPLEYGTPHPDTKRFPGFILTKEIDQDETWATVIYARDRVGQEEYNYTTKFSAESNAHPIYTRAYIFRRQGYEPQTKLTTDPLFTPPEGQNPAILVEEEQRQCEDDSIASLYILVIRAYETLDGPELTSSIYEDQLGLRIATTEQRIIAGSDPDPAAGTDIIPQTTVVDLKKSIDLAAIQAQLDAIHLQTPTQETVSLPPTIIGAKIYWDGQASDGYSTVEPQFQSAGWYSGGIAAQTYSGSASASATVDGDLSFQVRDGFKGSASAILHIFFLPLDATGDDILTKVGAVAWPVFRLTSDNVVVFGRHKSLDVSGKIVISALTQVGVDPILFVSTTKTGERRSGGLSTKSIPIPGALCAGITITEEGDSTITATATVERADPVLTVYDDSGSIIVSPTVTYDYGTWISALLEVDVEADGNFAPSSIPATDPPVFPTGNYLISSKSSLFKYGRLQITAVTVQITSDMV